MKQNLHRYNEEKAEIINDLTKVINNPESTQKSRENASKFIDVLQHRDLTFVDRFTFSDFSSWRSANYIFTQDSLPESLKGENLSLGKRVLKGVYRKGREVALSPITLVAVPVVTGIGCCFGVGAACGFAGAACTKDNPVAIGTGAAVGGTIGCAAGVGLGSVLGAVGAVTGPGKTLIESIGDCCTSPKVKDDDGLIKYTSHGAKDRVAKIENTPEKLLQKQNNSRNSLELNL